MDVLRCGSRVARRAGRRGAARLTGNCRSRARRNTGRAVRARLDHPRRARRGPWPARAAVSHVPRRPRARSGRVPAQPPSGPVFRSADVLNSFRPGHLARPSLWLRACGRRAVRDALGVPHARVLPDRPGASAYATPRRGHGSRWHGDHRHACALRPGSRGRLSRERLTIGGDHPGACPRARRAPRLLRTRAAAHRPMDVRPSRRGACPALPVPPGRPDLGGARSRQHGPGGDHRRVLRGPCAQSPRSVRRRADGERRARGRGASDPVLPLQRECCSIRVSSPSRTFWQSPPLRWP